MANTTAVDPYQSLIDSGAGSNNLAIQAALAKSLSGGQTVTQNSGGTSSQTSQGTVNTNGTTTVSNMSAKDKAALDFLIAQLGNGGTLQQKADQAQKNNVTQLLQGLLQQYSSNQAFTDAKGLMALNLQQSMQDALPSITRAMEGAGTSANSMQALLSQNLANDSALRASALGAEQAKAYAGASTGIAGQLAQLASISDPVTQQLLQALGVAKGATTTTTTNNTQTTSGSQMGTVSPTTSIATTTPTNTDPIQALLAALGGGGVGTGSGLSQGSQGSTVANDAAASNPVNLYGGFTATTPLPAAFVQQINAGMNAKQQVTGQAL